MTTVWLWLNTVVLRMTQTISRIIPRLTRQSIRGLNRY
jgi:hypothetical protein